MPDPLERGMANTTCIFLHFFLYTKCWKTPCPPFNLKKNSVDNVSSAILSFNNQMIAKESRKGYLIPKKSFLTHLFYVKTPKIHTRCKSQLEVLSTQVK